MGRYVVVGKRSLVCSKCIFHPFFVVLLDHSLPPGGKVVDLSMLRPRGQSPRSPKRSPRSPRSPRQLRLLDPETAKLAEAWSGATVVKDERHWKDGSLAVVCWAGFFLFDGRYVFYFWSFEFLMVWFCLLVSGVLDIGPLNEGGVLRLKRKVSLERSWPIEINGSDKGIVQVLRGAFCWESIFLIQKYILDGATGEHSNWFLWKPKPNKTGRKPRIWTWFSVWRVPRTEAYVQRWVAPRWLALRTWRIVCCW